jgi:uncharacterized protein YdgA (DUF945 family)
MNKVAVGVAAGVVVAGLAWAGSGVYIGMRAESNLRALASAPVAGVNQAWRVSEVQHTRGLFKSEGQLLASYSPSCASEPGADQGFSFRVTYTLQHSPLPTGAARFQWQLTPQGEAAEAFKVLFGSESALSGSGSVGVGGALRSDMNLPAVSLRKPGEVLEVAPSSGMLKVNGQALALEWKIDRAVARGNGQALELQGIVLDLDVDNRSKGTGSGSVKVAQANAGVGSMAGLELAIESREKGDRLNTQLSYVIGKLEGGGMAFSDLRMAWALNGLHTASIERLIKLSEDSCGMESLTAQESKAAAEALETILAKGFSFGVPKLSGKAADGSVAGSLMVELTEASAGAVSLAGQLRSSGKIEIKGAAITPEQRQAAVASGFAVAQGDTLTAGYEYSKGELKVNGRAQDAAPFAVMLAKADEGLKSALLALHNNTRPAVMPEAEAPVAAPEEAAPDAAPDASTEALAREVEASMQAQFASQGVTIKNFSLAHRGGSEYQGVLETIEPNGEFSYAVEVTYDGREFAWKIVK